MITQEQRDFMPGYFLTHDALRKDLRRLQKFIDRSSNVTVKELEALETWFHKVHEPMIMTHHHAEDDIFIPKMVAIAPSFIMASKEIIHEHKLLDEKFAAITTALSAAKTALNPASLAHLTVAINDYRELVTKHLDEEEPVVVETVMREMTKEQFLEIEKAHQKHSTIKDLIVGLPWAMDSMSDDNFAKMKQATPFFIIWLFTVPYLLWWRPAYRRLVRSLPA